jgi:hypothetical protein
VQAGTYVEGQVRIWGDGGVGITASGGIFKARAGKVRGSRSRTAGVSRMASLKA